MKLAGLLGYLVCFGVVASAQRENPGIVVDVKYFRYPAPALSDRVFGVVSFEVSDAGLKLVYGHSLFVPAAQANLALWTLPRLESGKYQIKYHFEYVSAESVPETTLIGNKFERLFRRLFNAPTKRTVYSCYDSLILPPHYTVLQEARDYIIDVFVPGGLPCRRID